MMNMIYNEMNDSQNIIEKSIDELQSFIYTACIIISETIENGDKILIFGNGENISCVQQMVSNINIKCNNKIELPAISLSSDINKITAIGNDFGFERVFDKQIEVLAKEKDVLVGISTSGNSKNVLRALSLGKYLGCKTIGLSGCDGGAASEFCDVNIIVPSDNPSRIYEMHMLIGNIICKSIDKS